MTNRQNIIGSQADDEFTFVLLTAAADAFTGDVDAGKGNDTYVDAYNASVTGIDIQPNTETPANFISSRYTS